MPRCVLAASKMKDGPAPPVFKFGARYFLSRSFLQLRAVPETQRRGWRRSTARQDPHLVATTTQLVPREEANTKYTVPGITRIAELQHGAAARRSRSPQRAAGPPLCSGLRDGDCWLRPFARRLRHCHHRRSHDQLRGHRQAHHGVPERGRGPLQLHAPVARDAGVPGQLLA